MVSFRKYLGVVIMMTMLFVIFLFSVMINEQGSFYDINEYVTEERPSGVRRWTASEEDAPVLLIGTEDAVLVDVVTQWCTYTKRSLIVAEQPENYETVVQNGKKPVLILLDGAHLDFGAEYKELLFLTEQEVPMIFCTIPDENTVSSSETLCDVLGIRSVLEEQVGLTGIRLFDGFFLGGAVSYVAESEEEEKRQDMNLTVPWYVLDGGTKTYMVGTMEEKEVREWVGLEEQEEGVTGYFPKLIWRNSYRGCPVFVVNGDYISSMAGMGILSSFCYELSDYEIYPVVNAQSVSVRNYPNLSEENEAKLLEVYSRSPQMVFQGIMWPSVSAMAKANELKLTCFFNSQYIYGDEKEPEAEVIPFYLKQLREINSEAGLTLDYDENTSFTTMLQKDTEFYNSLDSAYQYQMVFAKEKDLPAIKENLKKNSILQHVVTIGSEYREGDTLLSFFTDEVTLQRTTGNAKTHSYMDDFIVRGIQTALVYSNILLDLQDAVWPQEENDEWQHLYDDMASNVTTYWADYRTYEQTTLSESDARVRTLLNLDYSHNREENTIVLQVENVEEPSWFLLRTHDEQIGKITGGSFQKLEANAYLVRVTEQVAEIMLEPVSLKEQNE